MIGYSRSQIDSDAVVIFHVIIDVEHACPVKATRIQDKDLFLVMGNEETKLWIGHSILLDCVFSSSFDHILMGHGKKRKRKTLESVSATKITSLSECKGSFVSITTSDLRTTMANLRFHQHSALATSCLNAMQYCLSVELYFFFTIRFLKLKFEVSSRVSDEGRDWELFVVTLLSCLSLTLSTQENKKPLSEWEWLLQEGCEYLPRDAMKMLDRFNGISTLGDRNDTSYFSVEKRLEESLEVDDGYRIDLMGHMPEIMCVLHLVYQDMGLSVFKQSQADDVKSFLLQLSYSLEFYLYTDSLIAIFGTVSHNIKPTPKVNTLIYRCISPPLHINDWVNERIVTKTCGENILSCLDYFGMKYHAKLDGCDTLKKVMRLYNTLYQGHPINLITEMVKLEFNLEDLNSIIFGIALPLLEAIYKCRNDPSHSLSSHQAFELMGRDDLSKYHEPVQPIKASRYFANNNQPNIITERDQVVSLRFSKDSRISEVKEILKSQNNAILRIDIDANMTYLRI